MKNRDDNSILTQPNTWWNAWTGREITKGMTTQDNQANELDVENIITHLLQATEVQLWQILHDEQPFTNITFHLWWGFSLSQL